LTKIALTHRSIGAGFGVVQGGKEKRSQDAYNCDDNQQFNQSEPPKSRHSSRFASQPTAFTARTDDNGNPLSHGVQVKLGLFPP
jgi:hypothetical protein